MITATVLTRHKFTEEIFFEDMKSYKHWRRYWETFPNSTRLVHGWGRPIRLQDITRVIKVEEEN